MRLYSILAAIGLATGALALTGKSFTGWDCCKPGCAWKDNLKGVKGEPKVCDVNNNPLTNGLDAKSGCDAGGKGFLCADYAPVPQAGNQSYGFAVMFGAEHCCRCYSLTWTSGAATGKTMIVQAITTAQTGKGDVGKNDIVIQTPGGGSGDNDQGCRNQYGTNWGKAGGGVDNSAACANLPQNLQGGCYWRFNWAGGPMNGWGINYSQVSCPARLTQISGCSA